MGGGEAGDWCERLGFGERTVSVAPLASQMKPDHVSHDGTQVQVKCSPCTHSGVVSNSPCTHSGEVQVGVHLENMLWHKQNLQTIS